MLTLNDRHSTTLDPHAVSALRIDPETGITMYVIVDGCSLSCQYDSGEACGDDYGLLLEAAMGGD